MLVVLLKNRSSDLSENICSWCTKKTKSFAVILLETYIHMRKYVSVSTHCYAESFFLNIKPNKICFGKKSSHKK